MQMSYKEKIQTLNTKILKFHDQEIDDKDQENLQTLVEEYKETRLTFSKIESLIETGSELFRFNQSTISARKTKLENDQIELKQRIAALENWTKNSSEENVLLDLATKLLDDWSTIELDEIKPEEAPIQKSRFPIDVAHEEDKSKKPQDITKPLSLDEIIVSLTSPRQSDTNAQKNFLLTFSTYATPFELFERLVIRYCITPLDANDFEKSQEMREKIQNQVRLRVLNLIKSLMDLGLLGHHEKEQEAIKNFADLVRVTNLPKTAEQILSNLGKKQVN